MYPADIKILQGKELVKCTRLSAKGLYRFATTCCNTPICNTDPKRPWAGILRRMFTAKDAQKIDQALGKIKASILGKFAYGTLPKGVPQTFDFKGFMIVLPFILKGIILGRRKPSPFFNGETPVVTPHVLSENEREHARSACGPKR